MPDLLAALRRELHELECQAEQNRRDGFVTTAGWPSEEAMAHLRARIDTLEFADGNARSFPMDGQVAA